VHKLDKRGEADAMYAQLVTYFRDRILDGSFGAGTRLPPELEIAREHHISRGTVRQAFTILVNEGLLERTPGRGTFVREMPPAATAQGRSILKRVGLVLSQPVLQLSMDILLGVQQAAKSRGYEVSLTYAEESREEQARDIAWLKANEVAGIILFPVHNATADDDLRQLQNDSLPVVLIDRYIPDLNLDYVASDNLGGGYRATEHLIILGHSRIGFAYSDTTGLQTTSVRDRWLGYRKALQEYGLPYDNQLVFADLPLPLPASPNAYDDLVRLEGRPGAIFAVNDTVALGLLQAAQRQGVRVPEDLALVGFDDLSFAPYLTPPLTTVAQPRVEIGIRATNLLINRIEGQVGPYQHIELPANLIVRASCGVRLHLKNTVRQF
jgi:DNA-binding LacI/PurR family transcriptional regulator